MPISIQTAQNVNLQFELCSMSDRLVAYLIDAMVIAGFTIVLAFFGVQILPSSGLAVYFLFLGLMSFFYHLICELTMDGQSIGKRTKEIKVIKEDGRSATFSAYFLRFLLRPIDSIYGLGLAVIFFTKKGQRLGDLAAGTIIVSVKEKFELDKMKKEVAFANDIDYEITYQAAENLSDKEVQLIKLVLEKRAQDQQHNNIQTLANRVSQKIEVNMNDDDPYVFLKKVIQDYDYIYLNKV